MAMTEPSVGGGEVPAMVESATSLEAELSTREQEKTLIEEFRTKVDEMVLSLAINPSKVLQRKMHKFDRKLEQAVGRMAALGCVEECDEPDDQTEFL